MKNKMLCFICLVLIHVCYGQYSCTMLLSDLTVISNVNMICGKLKYTSPLRKGQLIQMTGSVSVSLKEGIHVDSISLSNSRCSSKMLFTYIEDLRSIYICGDYIVSQNGIEFSGFTDTSVPVVKISQSEDRTQTSYLKEQCILEYNGKIQLPSKMIRNWDFDGCQPLTCHASSCQCQLSCASILAGDGAIVMKRNDNGREQIHISPASVDFVAREAIFIHPWNSICVRIEIGIHSADVRDIVLQNVLKGYIEIDRRDGTSFGTEIMPHNEKCLFYTGHVIQGKNFHVCATFTSQLQLPIKNVHISGKIKAKIATSTRLTRSIHWAPLISRIKHYRKTNALVKESISSGNKTCMLTCDAAINERGYILCNYRLLHVTREEMYEYFHPNPSNITFQLKEDVNNGKLYDVNEGSYMRSAATHNVVISVISHIFLYVYVYILFSHNGLVFMYISPSINEL